MLILLSMLCFVALLTQTAIYDKQFEHKSGSFKNQSILLLVFKSLIFI